MSSLLKEHIEQLAYWTRILVVVLYSAAAFTFLTFLFELAEIFDVWSVHSPGTDGSGVKNVLIVVSSMYIVTYVAMIVVFGIWLYRAASNIASTTNEYFSYTARSAVGWFFVPIANFFKPFLAIRQIWNASQGAPQTLDKGTAIITIWWVMVLLANSTLMLALYLQSRAASYAEYIDSVKVGAISSAAFFVLLVVMIKLVREIANGQKSTFVGSEFSAT